MKKILLISLLVPFLARADTRVIISPVMSDTWTVATSPYILEGEITVPPGITLTIEPGVVVKASPGGGTVLRVMGSLVANGTQESPIIFTSLRDDSVAGDTNGDATSTVPQSGDWQGIGVLEGAIAELSNIEVHYAGHGGYGFGEFAGLFNIGGNLRLSNMLIKSSGSMGILNKSGLLDISHSTIMGSDIGIAVQTGTSTITDSILESNRQYGLASWSKDQLVLKNNAFRGNGSTAAIDIAADFVHEGNTSEDIANRGFRIGGVIKRDVTLHSRDLPLIGGSIEVARESMLRLAPGTIMKFGPSEGITVNGTLDMPGTEIEKTVLTTIMDDTVGGDTNGDGSATVPPEGYSPDDWMGIVFNPGSRGSLTYAEVRHGGGAYMQSKMATIYNLGGEIALDHASLYQCMQIGLYQSAGTTTISSSLLKSNGEALRVGGGTLSVTNSALSGNRQYALSNEGLSPVDARNNWWGSADGPHVGDTSTSTGDYIRGQIQYEPWLMSDVLGTSTPPAELPPDTTSYGTSTPVILIPGIMGSAEKNGEWIIDPILQTYDGFLATFRAGGYVDGQTLFTFPYDWRKSNIDTARGLATKIESVKQICACDKVNIVAHSMGGLVARAYVASADYKNDINQLIFLGTPHKGAPESYLRWEAGEFAPRFLNYVVKSIFEHKAKELGYSSLYNYIHEYPITSVKELLPITGYIHRADNPLYYVYPDGYPTNPFLESLDTKINSLISSEIRIKNYVGVSGADTIIGLRTVDSPYSGLWQHGYPEDFDDVLGDHGLIKGSGDGTVPEERAHLLGSGDTITTATHGDLPSKVAGQVYIDLVGTSTTQVSSSLPKHLLILQAFSPIDLLVRSPDGHVVGTVTNGSEVNEIEGAFYTGTNTDTEFITIPDPLPGEYTIEAVGTGEGKYTVASTLITDESTKIVEYTSEIKLGSKDVIHLAVEDNLIEEIQNTLPAVEVENPKESNKSASSRSGGRGVAVDVTPLPTVGMEIQSKVQNREENQYPKTKDLLAQTMPQGKDFAISKVSDNTAGAYAGASRLEDLWNRVFAWVAKVVYGFLALIGII